MSAPRTKPPFAGLAQTCASGPERTHSKSVKADIARRNLVNFLGLGNVALDVPIGSLAKTRSAQHCEYDFSLQSGTVLPAANYCAAA